MSTCTCEQAGARTHTHIQHSRNACFGFLLHCKKSCETFTVKWPENRDEDEFWIKKKCVPYCLRQAEVVTLTQDKEKKAKTTQSVQKGQTQSRMRRIPMFPKRCGQSEDDGLNRHSRRHLADMGQCAGWDGVFGKLLQS